MTYDITINPSGDFDYSTGWKGTTGNCYPTTYTPLYTYWSYSNTVYMYQLKCPECRKMNWCELDKTTTCKCGATLKAVMKKVDHEVEVG